MAQDDFRVAGKNGQRNGQLQGGRKAWMEQPINDVKAVAPKTPLPLLQPRWASPREGIRRSSTMPDMKVFDVGGVAAASGEGVLPSPLHRTYTSLLANDWEKDRTGQTHHTRQARRGGPEQLEAGKPDACSAGPEASTLRQLEETNIVEKLVEVNQKLVREKVLKEQLDGELVDCFNDLEVDLIDPVDRTLASSRAIHSTAVSSNNWLGESQVTAQSNKEDRDEIREAAMIS